MALQHHENRERLQQSLIEALDNALTTICDVCLDHLPAGYRITIGIEPGLGIAMQLTKEGQYVELDNNWVKCCDSGELLAGLLNVAHHLDGREALFLNQLTAREFLAAQSPDPAPSGLSLAE